MRVLYIVTAFPRWPGDVITPWLTETINRLGRRGIDVEVLAPSYRGMPSAEWAGIPVHRFRYAPAVFETLTHDQTAPDRIRERPWLASLLPGYVAAGSAAAIRLARTGRFDALHAFWPIPHGLLGLAGRRFSGVPLVSTFFGVELTWLRRQLPFLAPVARGIIRQSDAVTVISTHTAREVVRLVPEARVRTIPFGAAVAGSASDATMAREEREALPIDMVAMRTDRGALERELIDSQRAGGATGAHDAPASTFQLLFVGRLVERKGIIFLLRAIAAIRARGEDVSLRVIGDGPLKESLRADARALGIADSVEFTGFVSTSELSGAFSSCDVFVLPAVQDSKGDVEGLGVVLIEAMMHGKPVIASDSGGIADIVVDGESGLLVPPADVDALVGAITRLRHDPVSRKALAARGKQWAESRFSWDRILRDLQDLYGEVVSRQPADHSHSYED